MVEKIQVATVGGRKDQKKNYAISSKTIFSKEDRVFLVRDVRLSILVAPLLFQLFFCRSERRFIETDCIERSAGVDE